MTAALIIAEREFKEAITDWRTLMPMVVMAVLIPIVILIALQIGVPMALRGDPQAVAYTIGPFTLLMVGFFPASYSLLLALETFVGEKERNSLEPLLSLPLTTEELYFGKLVGATVLPLMGSVVALGLYTLGLQVVVHYPVPMGLLTQIVLLTALETLVMVTAAIVISTHSATIRAANLLASFVILPAVLLLEAEALLIIRQREDILWFIVPELVIVAVILIRLGIHIFDREELMARGVETFRVDAMIGALGYLMAQEPALAFRRRQVANFRPWQLYTRHIPQLIRHNRVPLAVAAGAFAVGLAVGGAYAYQYPLPGPLLNRLLSADPLLASLGNVAADFIFAHNMRVVLLMALLAIFSFGSVALLVTFLPGLVIAYLVASAAQAGLWDALRMLSLVMPHGLVELPAVFFAAALALRIGLDLARPPRGVVVSGSLAFGLVNFLKGLAVVAPLLLLAAIIEAHLTPRIALYFLGS